MDESEWGDSDSRDLAQSTGVWALRIAVLVVPFAFWPGIIRSAGLPKLAVVLVLSLVLASSCLTVRRVWLTRRAAFLAPLLVYLLITAAQAARCSNPAEGLLVLAAQTAFAMVCATTACLVRPGREMSLIRFSAVAGIGVACMGILEHLGVSWSTLPSAGRPSATFGFRNTAAAYLAINLPLSAALWLETRRRDWVLGAVSTGLMLAFLMLTRTRGAWVGLSTAAVIGLLVALWMRARAERSLAGEIWSRLSPVRRCAIAGCLALGLAMAWLPAGFADRGLQRLDEKKTGVAATVTSMVSEHGDRGRLRVWRHSLEMIADRPMIGVGLENWSVHYPRYDRGDVLVLPSDPQRPHNDFLWIWSELGTVGLLVYLWFLFVVGIEVVRRLKEGEEDERALALFLGVAMLAYLGHSVFSFPREQAAPSLLFWMAAGLIGRPRRRAGIEALTVGAAIRACAGLGTVVAAAACVICIEALRADRHLAGAMAAREAGAWREQAERAQEALDRGCFSHRAYLMLGHARHEMGDHPGAIETYQSYRQRLPYLPAIENNLGRAHEAAGDIASAEAAYRRGLSIFPGDPILTGNLASIYRKKGDADRALALYEGVDEGARTAESHHNLGLIYAERGDLDRAQDSYRKALTLDPSMGEVRYSLAGLYLLLNRYDDAVTTYEGFLGDWDGNPAYVRRARHRLAQLYPVVGDRAMALGDLAGARRAYEGLIELGEGTAQVHHNLALLYQREGGVARALAACKQALALEPKLAQARLTLGGLLEAGGDRKGALEAYRTFLGLWTGKGRIAEHARERVRALERGVEREPGTARPK